MGFPQTGGCTVSLIPLKTIDIAAIFPWNSAVRYVFTFFTFFLLFFRSFFFLYSLISLLLSVF